MTLIPDEVVKMWSNWSPRNIIFRILEENGNKYMDMRSLFLVLTRFMTLIRDKFVKKWSFWSHQNIIFGILEENGYKDMELRL